MVPGVSSLEKLFAEKFEGRYAIAMNSGTSTNSCSTYGSGG